MSQMSPDNALPIHSRTMAPGAASPQESVEPTELAPLPVAPNGTAITDQAPTQLELATEESRKPAIPTSSEVASYRTRSAALRSAQKLRAPQLVEVIREAIDLFPRLEGDPIKGTTGGIALLNTRLEWAKQASNTLSQVDATLRQIYQESPQVIIDTLIHDFVGRMQTKVPRLNDSHSASAIGTCLEQTRLMMIYAGRALKSEDHVASALSGLKERSFADGPDQAHSRGPQERSASDRQSSFAARQEAKAKAAEERRAALKSGSALPVRGAIPKPPSDSEKSELLTATVTQHTDMAEQSKPTDAQRVKLRMLPQKIIAERLADRLTQSKGEARTAELETLRIELVNITANRLKDWLKYETQLAQSLSLASLSVDSLPRSATDADKRAAQMTGALKQLTDARDTVKQDLHTLAKTVAAHSEVFQTVLTERECEFLNSILNPPKEKVTYELVD